MAVASVALSAGRGKDGGPFYLSIVRVIIQGLSSVRSIEYYKNLWTALSSTMPFPHRSSIYVVLYNKIRFYAISPLK